MSNWFNTALVPRKTLAGAELKTRASGRKTLACKQGVLTPPATPAWVPEQSDRERHSKATAQSALFSRQLIVSSYHEAAQTAPKHLFGTHARGIATLRGDATDARQHSHSLA